MSKLPISPKVAGCGLRFGRPNRKQRNKKTSSPIVLLPQKHYLCRTIIRNTLMNESIKDKTEYLIIFVNEFARRYQLTAKQAYRYLSRYKAIDFLCDQYHVAHTLSFDSMVEDMATYCRRFGGAIA
jgi:hypothetical protein